MRFYRARLTLCALCVTGTLSLSSCATKVIDSVATSLDVAPTTIPSGSARQLFDAVVAEATELGIAMNKADTAGARRHLANIDAIWVALRPLAQDLGDQTLEDLQRMIDLLQTAVERNRPADGDKALRFLLLLDESIPNN